jgi:hypothetical protein
MFRKELPLRRSSPPRKSLVTDYLTNDRAALDARKPRRA